jgi:hypothetical protein
VQGEESAEDSVEVEHFDGVQGLHLQEKEREAQARNPPQQMGMVAVVVINPMETLVDRGEAMVRKVRSGRKIAMAMSLALSALYPEQIPLLP